MTEDQPNPSQRRSPGRLLWILGLMAGVAVGAAAAFGLAGAAQPPRAGAAATVDLG